MTFSYIQSVPNSRTSSFYYPRTLLFHYFITNIFLSFVTEPTKCLAPKSTITYHEDLHSLLDHKISKNHTSLFLLVIPKCPVRAYKGVYKLITEVSRPPKPTCLLQYDLSVSPIITWISRSPLPCISREHYQHFHTS